MTLQIAADAGAPPYAPGKLNPGVHGRLVAELDRVSREAGVSPADVSGAAYHLTGEERAWLRQYRRAAATGSAGLMFVGQHDPAVFDRCRSVTGALVRNFIEARFMPREELIDVLFNGGRREYDCVVVPDLHFDGAPLATRRALASWLTGRVARNRQTVVGVPSKAALADVLGADAAAYVRHFHVVQGYVAT